MYLREVALCQAVERSFLGNGPFQGHLHHAQQIWQRILQKETQHQYHGSKIAVSSSSLGAFEHPLDRSSSAFRKKNPNT